MSEIEIGSVTHYYGNINVAIVKLTDVLKVGDNIHIKGHTSDFTQQVDSIQIEHKSIPQAKGGEIVGIRVLQKAHPHDRLFRITV